MFVGRCESRGFGPGLTSVREARHFAEQTARNWKIEGDDLTLMVSELAANVVIHASGRYVVVICEYPEEVLIEVADSISDGPTIVPVSDDATHGRGLRIVEALARSWGVRPDAYGGKVVWARLPLCSAVGGMPALLFC